MRSCRTVLKFRDLGEEHRVLSVNEVTKQMQVRFRFVRRQFRSRNKFDARRSAGGSHASAAFDGIMVR